MANFIPQIKLKGQDEESQTKGERLNMKQSASPIGKVNTIVIPKLGRNRETTDRPKVEEQSCRFLPRWLRKKGKNRKMMTPFPKNKKRILKVCGAVTFVLLVMIAFISILFYRVYKKGMRFKESGQNLLAAIQQQDLTKIKLELKNSKISLQDIDSSYKSVGWLRYLPYFGHFVADGEHAIRAGKYSLEAAEILLEAVEPYADILGFTNGVTNEGHQSGEETAQDRLDFIVKSIPEVIPKANILSEKVKLIQAEVDQIDANGYPERFAGIELKSKLQKGIGLVDQAAELIVNGQPLLEKASYLLGSEEERTYLILFQNDKELRPTGGFMTAYSIASVEKGKFKPVLSSDTYTLDNSYYPRQKAPEPIAKHLKGPYLISKNLRLRDMNWSPDFRKSMELFVEEAKTVGIEDIDGVIAVDTQLLVSVLDVLGPIGVPGYGEFSTKIMGECGCPQVIYELESFADIEGPIVWSENEPGKIVFAPKNYDNRKKIIGPLMNSILSNALGQSKEKIPALFEAGFKSLLEKHVLFYLIDDSAQVAVESFGIAGTIDEYNGDYLHINDANLGGRKSNLYVTQEVSQEMEIDKDGTVEKTVTITYKNPKEYDGWLNSVLPNWVRIYTPKGSELISFDGVEDKPDPYEDLGKTVFAGFFELRPQGVVKVTVKYKLPFKVGGDEYRLFIQKQPGTDIPLYSINIGKVSEEWFLKTDKEFKFSL